MGKDATLMKIHNLFPNVILETEDDMFPGIGASAFDRPKSKEVDQTDHDALFQEYTKLRKHAETFFQMSQKMEEYLRDNDAMIRSTNKPDLVIYNTFGWLYTYKEEHQSLAAYAISKNSPLFNDIEKYIRDLDSYSTRFRHFAYEAEKIQVRMRTLTLPKKSQ